MLVGEKNYCLNVYRRGVYRCALYIKSPRFALAAFDKLSKRAELFKLKSLTLKPEAYYQVIILPLNKIEKV